MVIALLMPDPSCVHLIKQVHQRKTQGVLSLIDKSTEPPSSVKVYILIVVILLVHR